MPVPVQSPSIQRSGPTISQPPTQEIPRHPEPAVLGGNSSYSNSIPEKRSPRKFRSKLPFRKKEKQSNEVRPAPNEIPWNISCRNQSSFTRAFPGPQVHYHRLTVYAIWKMVNFHNSLLLCIEKWYALTLQKPQNLLRNIFLI